MSEETKIKILNQVEFYFNYQSDLFLRNEADKNDEKYVPIEFILSLSTDLDEISDSLKKSKNLQLSKLKPFPEKEIIPGLILQFKEYGEIQTVNYKNDEKNGLVFFQTAASSKNVLESLSKNKTKIGGKIQPILSSKCKSLRHSIHGQSFLIFKSVTIEFREWIKRNVLRLAVDYYKENFETITQDEVGKLYDVPSYEISRKMNSTAVKKHNRLLSAEQEVSLLEDLEDIINNNIAVTKEMVLDMVLSLYKERTGITKEQSQTMFTKAKKRVIVIEKIDDKLLKENKTIALYKQKQNQHYTLKMEITIHKHYGTLYINNSGYMDYDFKKRMMIDFLDKLDHAKPKLILVDNHYLSPDDNGKRHKITSEQYPYLCYRAWQESFKANNIIQAWSKVGFINYSFTEPIDKRFLFKKKIQPPKPSNQLAVINTSQELVVHTPHITRETIRVMRKNKKEGCDLTSTEVSLIQMSTPPIPTNLPLPNTTQQISTNTYSLSNGISNLNQKIDLAIKGLLKKNNNSNNNINFPY
ncbi:hypothetical protein ACTFIZ_012319 [Dictyostelium cf. discoideum]